MNSNNLGRILYIELLIVDATFDERPNSKRNPTTREVKGKRNMNGKSKLLNPIGQRSRNDSQ